MLHRATRPLPATAALALIGTLLLAACAPAAPSSTPAAGSAQAPAAAAPGSAPVAAAPAAPQTVVKVSQAVPRAAFSYLPPFIGVEKGFYRDQGLDLELPVMSAASGVAALITSSVEFGVGGSALRAAMQGAPLRSVFYYYGMPMWEMVSAREITTVADLKGKLMGVSARGSSDEKSAVMLFEQASLDPERDVTFVIIPAGQQMQSLAAGTVQVVMLNADEAAHAEREGYRILKNVRDMYGVMPYATSGFATSEETLQKRPDVVKAWIRANLKTLQYMREDPQGTAAIAVKALGLEPEVAAAAIPKAIQGISTDDMGGITAQGAQLEIDQNAALAGQVTVTQINQLLDLRPLRQVQQELGLPCRGGYQCP